jgi:SAM-dependent methyltransferase
VRVTNAQSESTDDGWYAALENSVALDLFASGMPTGFWTTGYVPYGGLEEIADRLGRRAPQTLVDLGCGLGWPGLWVARSIGATLTGIDRSPAAIAMAKRAAGSEFPDVRATFVAADATATGLPVGATDAVMSLDVVQSVTDHQVFFDEVVRFVRPGDHIALTTWEARGGSDAPRFSQDVGRLMTEAGLVVEAIEERPAWRDHQTSVYERVLAAEADHPDDVPLKRLVAEARSFFANPEHRRRLLVMARHP